MSDTLASVLLVTPDIIDTPNGRIFAVGEGLKKTDNGPGSTFVVEPSGKLTSLATMGVNGIVAYNDTAKAYLPRSILGASGVNVENGDGFAGSPLITLQPESTVELIRVANSLGAVQATVPQINFKSGTGISIAINSVGSGAAAEVVINSTGGGPGSGTVTSVNASSSDSSIVVSGGPIVSSGVLDLKVGVLGVSHGAVGQTSYTSGDIIFASAATTLSKLAIAPSESIMSSNGTSPSWVARTAPTMGQFLGFDGTNIIWMTPPGTGIGTVTSVGLTTGNPTALVITNTPVTSASNININVGLIGSTLGGTGQSVYAAGDILYGSTINTLSKLPIGSANRVLVSNGTIPLWAAGSPTSNQVLTYDVTFGVVWKNPTNVGVTSVGVSSSDGSINFSGSPVTGVGTIDLTVGVIGISHGAVGKTTYSIGDMLYYAGGDSLDALLIGADHTILSSVGNAPIWVGGVPSSGNVLTYNGTTIVWAAPATSGTVTSVNASSSDSSILVSGGPIVSSGVLDLKVAILGTDHGAIGQTNYLSGDTLYYSSGTSLTKIPIGVINTIYSSTGTSPSWVGGVAASGNVLTYNGIAVVWAPPATSGTVTSIGLTTATPTALVITNTPVTSSGNININIGVVNTSQGGSGITTFTAGDMVFYASGTVLSKLSIGANNRIMASNGSAPIWVGGAPSSGNVLTYNGTTILWSAPATSGTVTSVGLTTGNPTALVITNTPVTSASNININVGIISETLGGTNQTTYTTGDILYSSSTNTLSKLTIGAVNRIMSSTGTAPSWVGGSPTSGNVLTYNGTIIVWSAPATSGTVTSVNASSSDSSILVSGGPIVSSGILDLKVAILGTDHGAVGQTSYTTGDMVFYASGTILSKLAIGAANRIMSSTGTAPSWVGGSPTSGNVLTYNGTTIVWSAPATSGTVTSVGLTTATPTALVITNTPVTSSANININIGIVNTSQGGSGLTTFTSGDMTYYSSGTSLTTIGIGALHTIMASNGTTPSFSTRQSQGLVYATLLAGAATIGSTAQLTGNLTVNTTAVKTGAFIQVNPISDVAGLLGARGYTLGYDTIVDSTSFRIVINLNGSASVAVNWLVINPIST